MSIKRKILKIGIVFFVIILLLPFILWSVLRLNSVQNTLISIITTYVNDKYHVKTQIGGVDIAFFNSVILEQVYIADNTNDTLFFVESLHAYVDEIKLKEKTIILDNVLLLNSKTYFREDSIHLNLFDFLDPLLGNDTDTTVSRITDESMWLFLCNDFELRNAAFKYHYYKAIPTDGVINFEDLDFKNINLIAKNFKIKDTLSVEIQNFGFREKSGFEMLNFGAKCMLLSNKISVDDVAFETSQSQIKLKYYRLLYDCWDDFSDFIQKVKMETEFLDGSMLNLTDISYFTQELRGMDLSVGVKGQAGGCLAMLKSPALKITYRDNTVFDSSVEIKDVTEPEITKYNFNIKQLTTSKDDLETVYMYPFAEQKTLQLPDITQTLGVINYKGVFMGTYTDFFVKGEFNSAVGKLVPYIKVETDSIKNELTFDGRVAAENLNVARLLENDNFGMVSFDFNLKGKQIENSLPEITLDGNIFEFDFNKYKYTDIVLKGFYVDDNLNYLAIIDDPNIGLDIEGSAKFSDKNSKIFLDANFKNVALYGLNFDTTDINSSLRGKIRLDISGNSANDIIGYLSVRKAKWLRTNDTIHLDNLMCKIQNIDDKNKDITIKSDFVDFNLNGKYVFSTLIPFFVNTFDSYIPTLNLNENKSKMIVDSTNSNDFVFHADIHKLEPITQNFFPDIIANKDITIDGLIDAAENVFSVKITTPEIETYDQHFKNLSINIDGELESCLVNIFASEFHLMNQLELKYFNVKSNISINDIPVSIIWDNYDFGNIHKGQISFDAKFSDIKGKKIPLIDLDILPTQILANKNVWNIENSNIQFDTTSIQFNNFIVSDKEQLISINGKISEKAEDTLNVNLNDFNLDNINFLTESYNLKFDGRFFGNNHITQIYNNPLVLMHDSINGLKINGNYIGNISITSRWNPNEKDIFVNSSIYNTKNDRTFEIKGTYQPENSKIDFAIKMDNFLLNFLNDFLEDNVSDITGFANSDLITISGTVEKPIINGKIALQKAAARINYLQTAFSFTDTIIIEPNKIILENINLTSKDIHRGTAVLNGELRHNNFENFEFSASIDAKKFLFMNTTLEDNQLYYGKAYASGLVFINGDMQNIDINVQARTDKNTAIYIPLSSGSEVDEKHFITFVSKDTSRLETNIAEEYKVDLTGIQLNFNLDVTPDAEVQLILDETVGDIIKARGYGNLEMSINTKGDFEMRGDYEIDKGDYLFTLQNVINKKFQINKGSRIVWTGDPYNADINITAVYNQKKVPLYDLVLEEDKRDTKVPVSCNISMTDKLMTPKIDFSIEVLEKSDEISSQLNNLPTDELNKQFLSLLVIRRFQPLPGLDPNVDSKGSDGSLGENAGEFLSNQLSLWLSQISNDVDIGVQYHGSDSLSSSQVEVALSTQLLNDRVMINGNVNMGSQSTSTSNFVGEFDIEYKITKNGKLRIKYYNKANDEYLYDAAPYKQGIALFYRKDFNRLNEIFKREMPDKRTDENQNNKNIKPNNGKLPIKNDNKQQKADTTKIYRKEEKEIKINENQ